MLAHHGSRDHSSGSALRFFQPDLFGIAAGDGGQYGHPSYELIHSLTQNYLIDQQKFLDKYELEERSLDLIAIQGSKTKFIETSDNQIPFLCPNLYGCIKWDQDGISTKNS